MIPSSKYGLRFIDLYFNEQIPATNADVIHYRYWSEPVAHSMVASHLNVVVDLRRDAAALFAAMAKPTRYDIRRAEREGRLSFHAYIGESVPLARFVKFFNAFADAKSIHRVSQTALSILADRKLLALTCICKADGSELIWHAYLSTPARVRLLHSASLRVHVAEAGQGQILARANRYHHWRDALLFRERSVSVLDLAGICEDSCDSPALKGIRHFKTGFGGDIVRMFDCAQALSARGRTALWLKYRLLPGMYSQWRPAAEFDREAAGKLHSLGRSSNNGSAPGSKQKTAGAA
jgi:hypothetical protein